MTELGSGFPHAPELLTLRGLLPSVSFVFRTHGSSPRSSCKITPGLGPADPAPGKETEPGVGAKDTELCWVPPCSEDAGQGAQAKGMKAQILSGGAGGRLEVVMRIEA